MSARRGLIREINMTFYMPRRQIKVASERKSDYGRSFLKVLAGVEQQSAGPLLLFRRPPLLSAGAEVL